MTKAVVAYFSATGTTAGVARALADELGCDMLEIAPKVRYTSEDLNWKDKGSRSTLEANDPTSRPELADAPLDLSSYDVVLLGFPIWWYVAPRILETWVEAADLAGKRVIVWATSGGSGLGDSLMALRRAGSKEIVWQEGRRLLGALDARAWAKELGL